jgi:transglutaminase-like putative cysteine protease
MDLKLHIHARHASVLAAFPLLAASLAAQQTTPAPTPAAQGPQPAAAVLVSADTTRSTAPAALAVDSTAATPRPASADPAATPTPAASVAVDSAAPAPASAPAAAPAPATPAAPAPAPAPSAAELERARWARADAAALAVPQEATRDVTTLAHALTDGLPTEAEKLRAIYRWVTGNVEYDVAALGRFGRALGAAQTPSSVLRNRKAVCDGFTLLIGNLALKAGLKAEFVEGRAKGLGVEEGEDGGGHSWAAVQVDGQWKLVDATWGAGDVVDRRFVRNVRDYYFMTPPEQLIWTHMPKESRWQLLDRPMSSAEFRRQPMLPREAFVVGLEAATLHAAATQPGFDGFTGIFAVPDRSIRMVDVPLNRTLRPGASYPIAIEAPGADTLTIVVGTEWTRIPAGAPRFEGSFTATPGIAPVVMLHYPGEAKPRVILAYAATPSTQAATGRR